MKTDIHFNGNLNHYCGVDDGLVNVQLVDAIMFFTQVICQLTFNMENLI